MKSEICIYGNKKGCFNKLITLSIFQFIVDLF